MRRLTVYFNGLVITTFLNSAARILIQLYQLLLSFLRNNIALIAFFNNAHIKCLQSNETNKGVTKIVSIFRIISSKYIGAFLSFYRDCSSINDSYRTPIKYISIGNECFWEAPAFRRNYVDAMSRVLHYAGLSE